MLKLVSKIKFLFILLIITSSSQAALISLVGERSEIGNIQAGFIAQGDTVNWYNTTWNNLSSTQLDSVFSADIVWEADIFNSFSSNVANRMINFTGNNGGLFLTGERICCEAHNDAIENLAKTLTGDAGLLVGGLGYDIYNHSFSSSPTTILTGPNDIRGQNALHSGPGQVSPTGGVNSNACFVTSDNGNICSAAAWGADILPGNQGRLVIYGDVNSQPNLVSNYSGEQFENIRDFLLAGFSGGVDVCIANPNLPGCPGNGNPPPVPVPEPTTLSLIGLGLLGLRFVRKQKK